MNREDLEDAVWELPHIRDAVEIDFTDIQAMPDDVLRSMLVTHEVKPVTKPLNIKPQRPLKARWVRQSVELRVVEAVLVKVETWKRGNETKEHVYACGVNVTFEGVRMSASIVRHYLLTGERVQRVPKPVKHRAVVRVGSRTVHLGYFDTIEERDAAKGKHLELISRKPLTH